MGHSWKHSPRSAAAREHPLPHNGFRLLIEGRSALFTAPEFKGERRSYPVITPSAAVGFLESIYWKPATIYRINKIYVLSLGRTITVTRNEIDQAPRSIEPFGATDVRTQRTSTILRDVSYVIEAQILGGTGDRKSFAMFSRRASRGQCYHQPVLGCREFAAKYRLLDPEEPIPWRLDREGKPIRPSRDFGTIFLRRKWADETYDGLRSTHVEEHQFFRAIMNNGVINVPQVSQ